MKTKYFNTVYLHDMKNFDHLMVNIEISNCLNEETTVKNQFPEASTAYLEAVEAEDEAMMPIRKSRYTPKLQDLDTERVIAYQELRQSVRDRLKSTNKEMAEAADFVWSIVKNHGYVYQMKQTERSGAILNLGQDITSKVSPEMEVLGLAHTVERMVDLNQQYILLNDNRLHEWSEYILAQVRQARRRTDDCLENLLISVAGGIIASGIEPFKHFVDFVNEVFKRANMIVGVGTKPKPEIPDSSGTESEVKRHYITFKNGNRQVARFLCVVGLPIPEEKIPAAPEGKRWEGIPELMPDASVTVNAVPLEEGEGGGSTNTPQDFTDEELRAFPIYPAQYGAVTEITNPNSTLSPFNPLSINYRLSNLLPGTPAPTDGEVPEGKAKVKFDREAEEEERKRLDREIEHLKRRGLIGEDSGILKDVEENVVDTKSFCLWYDRGSSVETQGFVPQCLPGYHWDVPQLAHVLDTAHYTIKVVKDEDENGEQDLTPGMDWPSDVPAPEGWTRVTLVFHDGREVTKLYRNGSSVYQQGGYPQNTPGYEWIGIHAILNGQPHTITEYEE